MSALKLERQDGVFVLHLCNGARANTMNDDVIDEYHAALDEVEGSEGNTALAIVSDDPKFWSNGIDLEYIKTRGMDYLVNHFVFRVDQLLLRVALLNAPTVAVIGGHAYGGGALLASACDFRTMRADRGYFCFPEVDLKLAFTPTMLEIVKLLPDTRSRFELAMTARAIGGTEAAEGSIVDAAFPQELLLDQSLGLAGQLATKDRTTYAAIKRGLRKQLLPFIDPSKR